MDNCETITRNSNYYTKSITFCINDVVYPTKRTLNSYKSYNFVADN